MQHSVLAVKLSDPWRVLIVDDEPEVHEVTRLVLGGFAFEGRPVELVSAYCAADAYAQLEALPEIAVMLLDVVMESDDAGLKLVRVVRDDHGNHFIRIILRTGQPGQAPEHEVIARYDINDYKEKTELTAQKLKTALYSAFRAYRDIVRVERSREGLERVIEASAQIFSHERSANFASTVLEQLARMLGFEQGVLFCRLPAGLDEPDHFPIAAATGQYRPLLNKSASAVLPAEIVDSLGAAYRSKQHQFLEDHCVLHFVDSEHSESLLYVADGVALDPTDLKLLQMFCQNVSIALENLRLAEELFDSQRHMIHLLAGAAETRSRETAVHVSRVGKLAELLADRAGLDLQDCEALLYAAPLHDVGKISIPDHILNKAGPHTPEETRIMRTHAQMGWQMLRESRRPLMQLAADICLTHHENWDGTGYPRGLAGRAIPIAGRLTKLADVIDALGSRRCYKDAWADAEIRDYLSTHRGSLFDPELTDLALQHWDAIASVRASMPDFEEAPLPAAG